MGSDKTIRVEVENTLIGTFTTILILLNEIAADKNVEEITHISLETQEEYTEDRKIIMNGLFELEIRYSYNKPYYDSSNHQKNDQGDQGKTALGASTEV